MVSTQLPLEIDQDIKYTPKNEIVHPALDLKHGSHIYTCDSVCLIEN